MNKMRKYLVLAVLVGLGLRLFFVLWFPAEEVGDTPLYEELARNWLHHHVYGFSLDRGFEPVDIRAPGYPAFLAVIYALAGPSRLAVMLVQAGLDLVTCVVIAALAGRLAPPEQRRRVAIAALWLSATCPFIANYSAAVLTEVLATFLTALALLVFAGALNRDEPSRRSWFLGGLVVGLGTLVRPETPLLLVAVAMPLVGRWRRPADWPKLARVGALGVAGVLVPLAPWAARNWHTLHRVQFLAPRYSELPEEYVPRGFYAWTRTWLVRFRDVYLVPWKLQEKPIQTESLPVTAFDSAKERARVATLIERYNATLRMSPEIDREFAQIARERTARHPLRTYLWIPLGRAATLWFTPRIELTPFSGALWPPRRMWAEDPVDFSFTAASGLLNLVYGGLALAAAWRWRGHSALVLPIAFVAVRTAFFARLETPEPRYVLECFPAVLALAALAWVRPSPTSAQQKRTPPQSPRSALQETAA
ncbi:MAG TPA: glycosyltransferase family 39 protein [Candidatus Acidoferrales bacterium]|nr:glycosyltransferase family 39 protein [Candidatus Acidoferrales bacterium]